MLLTPYNVRLPLDHNTKAELLSIKRSIDISATQLIVSFLERGRKIVFYSFLILTLPLPLSCFIRVESCLN